jgi:hypothetical protein
VKMIKIGSFEFIDYDEEDKAQLESWHLDAPFGCGVVFTGNKIIVGTGSPIFQSLVGQDIRNLPSNHEIQIIRELESLAERKKIARAQNPLDDMEMWRMEGPEGTGIIKTRGGLISECDSIFDKLKCRDIRYLPASYKIKFVGIDPFVQDIKDLKATEESQNR